MSIVLNLLNRNLKMYLRNKAAVFFSFLSIIIIIGLYALFLGETQIQNIKSMVGDIDGIGWLSNSWIMAGIISVNTLTVTLGSFGVMVNDMETNATKEFMSSPIKRSQVVLGYIMASWILGIVISLIGFVIVEAYIILTGGQILSFVNILKVILVIILSVVSNSAILFFTLTFIKSNNAFAALSSIIGTAIGFLSGVYVPVGVLPGAVQNLITILPFGYSASILRQIFMEEPLQKVFNQAPQKISEYSNLFGVKLYLNDFEFTIILMVVLLIIYSLLFYGLSVLKLVKSKIN
jgi:multidrug/hemolysin transport system permease protein